MGNQWRWQEGGVRWSTVFPLSWAALFWIGWSLVMYAETREESCNSWVSATFDWSELCVQEFPGGQCQFWRHVHPGARGAATLLP